MKLPFITRKKHDKDIDELVKAFEERLKDETEKAHRKAWSESADATVKRLQACWDHGLNIDGSRQKLTFDHLWGDK